jgi:hypothetical protein
MLIPRAAFVVYSAKTPGDVDFMTWLSFFIQGTHGEGLLHWSVGCRGAGNKIGVALTLVTAKHQLFKPGLAKATLKLNNLGAKLNANHLRGFFLDFNPLGSGGRPGFRL